jgi:D-alanyl-lipoteichoic acid acyltransferase DltB (MBOAT superfamily)
VIADNCAIYVNQTFADSAAASSSTLILAAMLFAFQIYCDFSGYSDIAIGTARLFGFRAMRNFNFPYFSRDIAEFWRRWHISLTTWFRDYVYIPLGGSRVSKTKIIRNTFVIFLVSGFWHGANWTFLLWGAYHALLFLPLILLHQNRKFTDIVANNSRLPNIKELLQIICTFGLVCIGWIIFRAENMGQAVNYFLALFSANFMPLELMRSMYIPILSIIFMLTVEWIGRKDQYGLETFALKWKPIYRLAFYYALIALIFNYSLRNTAQEFIYFQF